MKNAEIENRANEVHDKYNKEHLVPFPVYRLEKDKGDLDVVFGKLQDDSISGFIFFDDRDSRYKIFINSSKHQNRVNFTLAHELGHYFLHEEFLKNDGFLDNERTLDGVNNMLYRTDGKTVAEHISFEREANRFASYLLMPRELVLDAWKTTCGDVKKSAEIFGVSVTAMTIRLHEIGLVD